MEKSRITDLNDRGAPAACSLLIATYNRPGSLRLILRALNIQTVRNFEVVICDDGSTPGTLEMVHSICGSLDYDVRYVWQEDKGFRKAMTLNRGILAARTDYLLFLDDDCLPHSRYVEGHLRRQSPGCLVFGKFVKIGSALVGAITEEVIQRKGLEAPPFFTPKKKMDLALNRLRFYKHLVQRNPLRPKLYGANFAVDKASLYNVNGFNEAFEGWGYEDNELRLRLVNSGVKIKEAITAAVVFHLDLREDRKKAQYLTGRSNKDLFLEHRQSKWAARGLSDHPTAWGSQSNG
jgi:glycosyltransferase involved in cell wall biosynthesis